MGVQTEGFPTSYYNIQNINRFCAAGIEEDFLKTFNDKGVVYHFGVSKELWNDIKGEYEEKWQLEEFVDAFYDTDDFLLANNNQWLRQREFRDGRLEWSLKTTHDNTLGRCLVEEAKDVNSILQLLNHVPKRGQPNAIKDPIYGIFKLAVFVFFPTTRVYLERSTGIDQKLYVDCANEELTETWFFIGGILVKNASKLNEYQKKWRNYSPDPVMTKITQILLWKKPELYDSLVEKGFLLPKDEFPSESHIYSDDAPIFPCSMMK